MELNYEEHKIKNIFINLFLKKGKKTKSEKIYKNTLINIKKNTKQKPNFILLKCIKNLMPKIKVINISNKNKSFLMFLNNDKQIKESIKWLQKNANLNNILNEIILTSKNKSKTILTKKSIYKEIKKLKFNIYF